MAMRQTIDLPNQDGFEFIGVTKEGGLNRDRVVEDPETGCCKVEGLKYSEYIGWFTVTEYEQAQRETAPMIKPQPRDVKAGCYSI